MKNTLPSIKGRKVWVILRGSEFIDLKESYPEAKECMTGLVEEYFILHGTYKTHLYHIQEVTIN